jgi:hypothetical protein
MPRNGSGTYTLPAGNPVVSGDIIESSWANSTLSDLADSMTNSLARNGEGGMTAPLRLTDGVVTVPSLAFSNETGSGLYRAAAGDLGLAVLGARILRLRSTGVDIDGALAYTGTLTGGTSVVNIGSGQIYKDASGNVGIGTSSPTSKLHLSGSTAVADLSGGIRVTNTSFTAGTYAGVLFETADGLNSYVTAIRQASFGGILAFGTNSGASGTSITERMRIDSSGNVGIGVTPSAWTSSAKAIEIGGKGNAIWNFNSAAGDLRLTGNAYFDGAFKYGATGAASSYTQNGGQHSWSIAPSGTAGNAISFTQAMTLNTSGQLFLGTTSGGLYGATQHISSATCLDITNTASAGVGIGIAIRRTDGAGGEAMRFLANTTVVGFINTTSSATSYLTSSDYRLKENVAPMTGALAKVAQLKPCTYTWKADGSAGQGFIAHELQAVVPDCVMGEKDAVQTVDDLDAEGKKIGTKEVPRYQGVDTSFLVATLVAAIQELKAEVDALKSIPAA